MIHFFLLLAGLFVLFLSIFILNDLLISHLRQDSGFRLWWERNLITHVPDDLDI